MRFDTNLGHAASLSLACASPFHRLAQSVKLMIALAILLTYSLQFYVPMEIIWKNVRHKFSEDNKNAAEWTIRYMLVVSDTACQPRKP